ncbi:hypothetical protein MOUN0_L04192 [Monosporozyma unispora]
MSLLNKLVESRRKRILQLRGKYEDISSTDILEDNVSPEWSQIRIEHNNNARDLNSELSEEEDGESAKKYDSDVSMTSNETEEDEYHSVGATKDLEMKLKPQIGELEKRTNMALKRILRRNIIQKDVQENSIEEQVEETS